jgi:hypothetical protein
VNRPEDLIHVRLYTLSPKWVEFTGTKGVLRCLQPGEERARATGIIFLCPWCKDDREKKHYCIFLFDDPRVPPEARPLGRFIPSMEYVGNTPVLIHDFHMLTLKVRCEGGFFTWFTPQDMFCGFECEVLEGTVSFFPPKEKRKKKFWERIFKWKS